MPGLRIQRVLPLLFLPLWAVGAPTASHGDEPRAGSRRNCGFEAARRDYFARIRTGSDDWGSRPARACAPPDSEEIAAACAAREAVSVEAEGEFDSRRYDMPAYTVRGARCRLTGRQRSDAYCRFELGRDGPAPAWRKVRMRFRYRFGIVSDEMGHPVEFAMWQAEGVCTAAETPATH
jgi:hypothetical protein